mmetsp:Transcript_2879/g.8656  ORF Transcript_2879/g.8656 Transcript_2879/m.8656 type:complete len:210 (+) Transcript_2879:1513-2142(+)
MPPEPSRISKRETISSVAALDGAHTSTCLGGSSTVVLPSCTHMSDSLARGKGCGGSPVGARAAADGALPRATNEVEVEEEVAVGAVGASMGASARWPSHGDAAAKHCRVLEAELRAGRAKEVGCCVALLGDDEAADRSTDSMPRMVFVFPVPGGPWINVMPRPQSALRIAASCDGLCCVSIACSSTAEGSRDGGACMEPSAPTGVSSSR